MGKMPSHVPIQSGNSTSIGRDAEPADALQRADGVADEDDEHERDQHPGDDQQALVGQLRSSAKVATPTTAVSSSPSETPARTIPVPELSCSACRKSTVSKPSRKTLVKPST